MMIFSSSLSSLRHAAHLALLALAVLPLLLSCVPYFSSCSVVEVNAGAILGKKRMENDNPQARSISIDNQSGHKLDMFWVNVFKEPEEFVAQFIEDGKTIGCAYGADKAISSYIGHQFEIREIESKATGACVFNTCRKVRIKVSDREDQKFTIDRDFSVTVTDDKERAYSKVDDMFARCKEKVAVYADASSRTNNNIDPLKTIELITNCMEEEINGKVNFDRQERSFHSKLHRDMATDLIPFMCGDVNKTDSIEIVNTTWISAATRYTVKTLHELPTSEIFVVDDFVTKETCDALKIYRQTASGSAVGVPIGAIKEGTKQAKLLETLYFNIYALIGDRYGDWGELDFFGETLFEYIKDPVGVETPLKLCDGPEEVAEAFADIEAGKPKLQCQIPGGDPVMVPTKRIVVEENGIGIEDVDVDVDVEGGELPQKRRQLSQLFLFCDEPENKLGGLHFPFSRVHVTPEVGKLVVAVHRHATDESNELDGYVNEYHLCPNHEVYVHTVTDLFPAEKKAEASAATSGKGGDDEL